MKVFSEIKKENMYFERTQHVLEENVVQIEIYPHEVTTL